jgi:glucose-1-phosphatase
LNIEALVFDFGNVLVDIDFDRAFAVWARAAGVPVTAVKARFSVDAAYCAHERGELDLRGYFASLRHSLGVRLTDEQLLAGWEAILGEPIPGIEPVVSELAALWPLYVFSNTNPSHAASITSRYAPLLRQFRHVFTSCELGARKPEPQAFERLAKRIGTAPERLVFFDDLEENVLGARAAGLQAHRVARPEEIARIVQNLSAR